MLTIEVPVNPANISVNIRYLSNSTVPPAVRREMDTIVEYAELAAQEMEWEIGATDYLDIHFIYYFENWRPDLDNPIKRSLDALSEALVFNDNRVVHLCVTRRIDPVSPRIRVEVVLVPLADVPSPRGMKRKNADPVWVSEENE